MKIESKGNMNIELFIKNLFKLLDQQNNTNTKVSIRKVWNL